MKKVHATANFGFYGAEHEEDFEFENDATESEIYDEIFSWATSFIDIDYETEEEDEEEED